LDLETVWIKLTGLLPEELTEEMEARLFAMGVTGIQTITSEFLPPDEEKPKDGHAYLVMYLEQAESFEQSFVFKVEKAWKDFLKEKDLVQLEYLLLIEDMESNDWATSWKEFFHPLKIGKRIWISPSWEPAKITDNEIAIEIDPGMAFGTGGHESTALLIKALEERADASGLPSELMDVGCGSGVLSITALKLGSKLVDGIDIDPEAVRISAENLAINKLDPNRYNISQTAIADIKKKYPLVLANMISSILYSIKSELVRICDDNGELWLSGILAEEADEVAESFTAEGLELTSKDIMGEWASLQMKIR